MKGIGKSDTVRRVALAAVLGSVWLAASFAHGQHNRAAAPPQAPRQPSQPHSQPSHPPQPAREQQHAPQYEPRLQQRPSQYQSHPQQPQSRPVPQSHPYTQQPPTLWFHDLLHGDGTPYRQREAEILRALSHAPRGVVPAEAVMVPAQATSKTH